MSTPEQHSSTDPTTLIEELKSYIGFGEEDVTRLRALAAPFESRRWEFSQRFYDFILRNEAVRHVIEGNGRTVEALRTTWEGWATDLFAGEYDGDYARRRLNIGMVHLHIGVEERYTVAAFHLVRQFLIEMVCDEFRHTVDTCLAMISSVNRVLDLDLSLICDAYDRELHAETVAGESRKRRTIEDMLRVLLAAPSLLVLSIDAEGKIGHYNRGCELLFDLERDAACGADYVETLVSEEDRSTVREELARVFGDWSEASAGHGLSPHRLRAHGSGECFVTWYPTAISGENGDGREFLWIGHDTTEEQRLQGQIIHQEKMAALGLLAAGVAHEIGNPLASISSVAQTLLRKSDDEYLRGKLGLVSTHIDRIANIVHRMVDFARPPRYEWRPCDVNGLVHNAAQILEYDKRARKVAIELDLADELPTTVGMEDQLTQVFLNIVLNALDAVDGNPTDRPPRLQIETRLEPEGTAEGTILFRCRDNGPGIDPLEVRRVFEPFYTTKEVGRGTGLGLSVSFRIIDEHGGRISVETTPGGGATFEIRIPVRRTPPRRHDER